MSRPVLLRLCPLVTTRELLEPERVTAGRTLYDEGSLQPLFLREDMPVYVDHNPDRVVGRVRESYECDDAGGGRWWWASCDIDDVPGWLRKGGGASFEYRPLFEREMPGGWTRVQRAAVSEISLLSPSLAPAEPRARVAFIGEERSSSPTVPKLAGEVFGHGEQIIYGGQWIRRPAGGVVLGVR